MIKWIFVVFGLFFSQLALAQGNNVGNGGDPVVAEFVEKARNIFGYLKDQKIPDDFKSMSYDVYKKLSTIQIVSKDKLFLNDQEVDAINYPHQLLIELSRTRWVNWPKDKSRAQIALVIHEVIWVLGYDDQQYKITTELLKYVPDEVPNHEGYFASRPKVTSVVKFNGLESQIVYHFESDVFYGQTIHYECSLNYSDFEKCVSPFTATLNQGVSLFKVRAVSVDRTFTPESLFDFKADWKLQFNSHFQIQIFDEGLSFTQENLKLKSSQCKTDIEMEMSSCWNRFSFSPYNPGSKSFELHEVNPEGLTNSIVFKW